MEEKPDYFFPILMALFWGCMLISAVLASTNIIQKIEDEKTKIGFIFNSLLFFGTISLAFPI